MEERMIRIIIIGGLIYYYYYYHYHYHYFILFPVTFPVGYPTQRRKKSVKPLNDQKVFDGSCAYLP